MQDAIVARSHGRLENTRLKCLGAEENRQRTASEIQRLENNLTTASSAALSSVAAAAEAKAVESRLGELKSTLDAQTVDTEGCRSAEAEEASQLKNDENKLSELQAQISRIDQALAQMSVPAK
jgi:chromosome segregation ATPase